MLSSGGLTSGSSPFSQPTKIRQKRPGIERSSTKLERVLVGVGAKISIKSFRNGGLPKMNMLLRYLAIEGVYYYILEDMLIIPKIALIPPMIRRSIIAILGKSAIEYGIDWVQKSTKPKPIMTYLTDEGMSELIVLGYHMFIGGLNVPKSGSSRVFIS